MGAQVRDLGDVGDVVIHRYVRFVCVIHRWTSHG